MDHVKLEFDNVSLTIPAPPQIPTSANSTGLPIMPSTQIQQHPPPPAFTNPALTNPIFAPAMTHPVARASPTTIRWLLEHFEPAAGVSLPRATMYQHYCLHCEENAIDPVNAASFGKLVRSVFVGLRTRRLGTRGNSKYHYYGIRMKLDSPLQSVVLPEPPPPVIKRESHSNTHQTGNIFNPNQSNFPMQGLESNCSGSNSPHGDLPMLSSPDDSGYNRNSTLSNTPNLSPDSSAQQQQLPTIPPFPQNPEIELKFKSYAQEFIESIVQLKFNELHDIMMSFYANHTTLTQSPEILEWLARAEITLYQTIIAVLFPSVILPMPASMNDTLRQFSKSIQDTIQNVLNSLAVPIEQQLKQSIISRIKSFSQLIRRITLLNHLSHSIHTILKANEEQRHAVVHDLSKISITKICQDCWITDPTCVENVGKIWSDMKSIMETNNSASSIIQGWKKAIESTYAIYRNKKTFIMTWNFISSTVVRDLTLRSVTSFGSILVLRLFLDELVQYVVLEFEAKATDAHLITVKL